MPETRKGKLKWKKKKANRGRKPCKSLPPDKFRSSNK